MTLTEEFCNREYNPRPGIPDHLQIFERWARDGAEVRRRHPGVLDVPYGADRSERIDLFPAARRDAPLLFFIHGGYWRSLDKADFSWVAPPFVAHGVAVAVVNYALAPAVGIEHICVQVVRALAWLHRHGAAHGVATRHVVVAGHSAGGHLTAMAMCARFRDVDPEMPADLVKGGLAVSGLYDLEPIRLASFLNVDLKLTPERVAALSPAYLPPATDAPLVTAVGGDESSEFKRQNALIARQWPRNFRRDVPMPGCHHLHVIDRIAEPDSALHQAALGLCRGTA